MAVAAVDHDLFVELGRQLRVDAIRADALAVRMIYIAGYRLSALGVGLLGAELFVLPAPTAGGGSLQLRGRF